MKERDLVLKVKKVKTNVLKSRNKYASTYAANRVSQLQDQNSQYKRQIKALTRNDFNPTPNSGNYDNEHSVIDAGDTFGGCNIKAGKRRKIKQDIGSDVNN